MNEDMSTNVEQFRTQTQDVGRLKEDFKKENELIVKRFLEQKDSMDSFSMTLQQQFEKIGALEANEV